MISQRLTPRPPLLCRLLTLLLLTALIVPPASARPAKRYPKKPKTQGKGLFIAIDPITHRPIAPTPDQIRAWNDQQARDALRAPTRPLQTERLPNGGEIIHLNGAFRSYSIARRDAQGRIVTDCVPDAATARELLSEPAPKPKAPQAPEVK